MPAPDRRPGAGRDRGPRGMMWHVVRNATRIRGEAAFLQRGRPAFVDWR
jgi:hypothetical protein